MFFVIRTCLIIGLIFHFSPVRQNSEQPVDLPNPMAQAEAAWRDLSAEARKALLEELRISAAASLGGAAQRLSGGTSEPAKRP
jgi:hypothetical protein